MEVTYDLTAGPRKGTFNLYLSPASISTGVREAGIQIKPNKSTISSHGCHYVVTLAAARRLATKFPGKVTYYGEPLPIATGR